MPTIIKPEFPDEIVFITTRTNQSRLWFPLSEQFEEFVYSALARYQEIHNVQLFAFVTLGNHFHILAKFPEGNRAAFMRDFNGIISKSLKYFVPEWQGGILWGRPYRFQIVPTNYDDVLDRFLYTVLNPVSSGISKDPIQKGRVNSLKILLNYGGSKACLWFNRTAYQNAKRKNPNIDKSRYYSKHTLTLSRIPGLDHEKEYTKVVMGFVEQRRLSIIEKRISENLGFLPKNKLEEISPGALPKSTKKSRRDSYNPLVLSLCKKTKDTLVELYLGICNAYKEASAAFRDGHFYVEFPPYTYRPWCHALLTVAHN